MTLAFPDIRKLMEFIRNAGVRNYELRTEARTITLDFSQAQADDAFENYGAKRVEDAVWNTTATQQLR